MEILLGWSSERLCRWLDGKILSKALHPKALILVHQLWLWNVRNNNRGNFSNMIAFLSGIRPASNNLV